MRINHGTYSLLRNRIFPSILSNSHTNPQNSSAILLLNGNTMSLEERTQYDVAIVGGGIIGTAIARELKERSRDLKAILIEKEGTLGKHQSSHNSGVIHSGIYYKPGSLKAKFCVKGAELMYQYCKEKNISFKTRGKLVIATNTPEIDTLYDLFDRGEENRVKHLEMLSSLEEILKIEPNAKGIQALWSPNTGNVDFLVVTESFGKDFRENGGDILFNNQVKSIKCSGNSDYPVLIKCNENLFIKTKFLILCGGLQSGTLSALIDKRFRKVFVSFRVDYQLMSKCISTNIYAVPDLKLPFLGVHLSPKLDGTTLLGPTAVPALKLEGYEKDEISLKYLGNTLTSAGFQNMSRRYLSKCIDQVTKNVFPSLQLRDLQKLAYFNPEDVREGPCAAQIQFIGEDGTFVDDFVFDFFKGQGVRSRTINCKFIPSPGATGAMAIAQYVVDKFLSEFSKTCRS